MNTGLEERRSLYASVYQAVDASIGDQKCLPASEASVQRALALLRRSGGDPEAVRQLEDISVRLHQLTAATLRPQEACRRTAVEHLSKLASQWMSRAPIH